MKQYIAEIFLGFGTETEIIALKAATYTDAEKKLKTIITHNPSVLGGKFI
jgi:hypothetical protein